MEPIGFSRKKASEMMHQKGVDVLVASSRENVFYTSGLPTIYATTNPILLALSNQYPSIVVIPVDGEECLIAWQLFRSVEKVSWIKKVSPILSRDEALQRLVSIIRQTGLQKGGTIGVESVMPIYQYDRLVKALPDAKFRVSDDVFTEMRLEKSDEEIRRMREATKAAEKTVVATMDSIREGISTKDLAKIATTELAREGAASVSHITVGIGDSDPEYPSVDIKMRRGDIAKLDIGAVYEGYCCDISRQATINTPPKQAENLASLMVEVQEACIEAIRPGTKPVEAVDTAYSIYHKRGGIGFFFMSIHSIGISIEDYTFYDTVMGASAKPFGENMVIDVETSTVLPQLGFIGIADPYLVTSQGCMRISQLEKKIFHVRQKKERRRQNHLARKEDP